jgi:phosphomannomutase
MSFALRKPSFLKKEPVELSFGTSGLRGLVVDMTDLECYINTKGFLRYLTGTNDISTEDTICIAGDLRPSTGRIMAAVAAAIEHSGCKVDNCGLIPTPAIAYYAMQKGRASIMITGSHIPENRNGIKFYKHDGEILKADEDGIVAEVARVRREEYARSVDETLFDESGMFKQPRHTGPANEEAKKAYIHRYLDVFPLDCLSGKTIIVYQHSAVGRDMLAYMLESLGSEVIPVKRSDEFIAIDTENMTTQDRRLFRLLADKYKQRHLFAIVSTDGDGDRSFIIDEKGESHRGDVLGIVVCQYLNAQFAAVPISANDSVAIQLKKNRIMLKYTKIGSPYVIEAMKEAIAQGKLSVVSWEVNGGFLTGTDFSIHGNTLKALPTRDAFLPILCALAQATKRDIAVSELFAELPRRYTDAGVLDNFPQDIGQKIIRLFSLPEENNTQQVSFEAGAIRVTNFANRSRILDSENPIFKALLSNKIRLERFFNSKLGFDSITRINYLDGIRITFANGDIAHIRPSGNAPQFRVYSNANSQERATKIVRLSIAESDGIIQQMTHYAKVKDEILHNTHEKC